MRVWLLKATIPIWMMCCWTPLWSVVFMHLYTWTSRKVETYWTLISCNTYILWIFFPILCCLLLTKFIWLSCRVSAYSNIPPFFPARCPGLSFKSSAQTWWRARKNKRTIIIFSQITSSRCRSPHVEAHNCCLQISGGTTLPEDLNVGVRVSGTRYTE